MVNSVDWKWFENTQLPARGPPANDAYQSTNQTPRATKLIPDFRDCRDAQLWISRHLFQFKKIIIVLFSWPAWRTAIGFYHNVKIFSTISQNLCLFWFTHLTFFFKNLNLFFYPCWWLLVVKRHLEYMLCLNDAFAEIFKRFLLTTWWFH